MPTEYDNIIQRLWWKATIGYDDMREAAEFEAQVAAKLADIYSEVEAEICHVCPVWSLCFGKQDCRATILKYARLLVEEEINANAR